MDEYGSSFVQYLFSNASRKHYPTNQANHFKTVLPQPINLHGNWEVGLSMMSYPNNWQNLLSTAKFDLEIDMLENFKEGHFQMTVAGTESFEIPSGFYKNHEVILIQLVEMLNSAIPKIIGRVTGYQMITTDRKAGRYELILDRDKHIFKIATNVQSRIVVPDRNLELWRVLGYDEHVEHIKFNQENHYEENILLHLPALFVYSPIVEFQNIGDTKGPLLALVPVKGTIGEYIYEKVDKPIYNRLAQNYINEIEIDIRDHRGEPVKFQRSIVAIILHFKRVD